MDINAWLAKAKSTLDRVWGSLANLGGQREAQGEMISPIPFTPPQQPEPTLNPQQEELIRNGMTRDQYFSSGLNKVRPVNPNIFPTATPTQMPPPQGQVLGNQAPPMTPTPTMPAQNLPPGTFDFPNYVQGKGVETLQQPPPDVAQILWNVFGPRNEATQAASVMAAEHLNDPWATDLIGGPNKDGSYDYGGFQVNENTFRGEQKRRPGEMNDIAGRPLTLEDLLNFAINAKVAELVRKDEDWNQSQGYNVPNWGQWYGWQDKDWSFKR